MLFAKRALNFLARITGHEIVSNKSGFVTGKTPAVQVSKLIRMLNPKQTVKPLVRLGPSGDGGYLIPDDIDGVRALFSPGVSSISGFEKDCADRGMTVYLADKSVDGPAESDELFFFQKKHIGCIDDDSFMSLDSWVGESTRREGNGDGDLLLQMDIEGSEYEAILSTSGETLWRFRVIVIEFHWLGQLWNRPFYDLASRVWAKILQSHACVHIHPNNHCGSIVREGIEIPNAAEFTFLRNDREFGEGYISTLPHPLDVDNMSSDPPLQLANVWLGGSEE